MLLLAVLLLIAQVLTPPVTLGVARVTASDLICLAIRAPVQRGSTVTLVAPNPPQSVMTATVEQQVASCNALERAMIDGPYYSARTTTGAGSMTGELFVVFPGRVSYQRERSGAIVVRLSRGNRAVRVRSCTSAEGLHLTAWAGTPLRSLRLWHQYFYLGFDVESDCDERDV